MTDVQDQAAEVAPVDPMQSDRQRAATLDAQIAAYTQQRDRLMADGANASQAWRETLGSGDDATELAAACKAIAGRIADADAALTELGDQRRETLDRIAEAERRAAHERAEAAQARAREAYAPLPDKFIDLVDELAHQCRNDGVADGGRLNAARAKLDWAAAAAGADVTEVGEMLRHRSANHYAAFLASGEGWAASCHAIVNLAQDRTTPDPVVAFRLQQDRIAEEGRRYAVKVAAMEEADRARGVKEARPPYLPTVTVG